MDFIVSLLIRVLLTAAAYMIFPISRLIINRGKFEQQTAKKIALWNSIVLGLVFCILTIELSAGETAWNAGPAVLYYWINRTLLTRKKAPELPTSPSTPITTSTDTPTAHSLSSADDKKPAPAGYDFYGSEFRVTRPTAPEPSMQIIPTSPQINSKKVEHTVIAAETPPKAKPIEKYCSRCGKPIEPISKKCTGCCKQHFKGISLKTFGIVSTIVVVLIAVSIILLVGNNRNNETGNNKSNKLHTTENNKINNVGVRTISFEDKALAEEALATWENGTKTETSMIEIMDEYGSEQGGGQLYIITRGEFVEEIEEWCFSSNRKKGDYVIIESAYGFSLCYYSGYNLETSNKTNINNNTLIVAMESDYHPYSWEENKKAYGIHVDIANEMADRMGFNSAAFVFAEFNDIIEGVSEGTYDIAFGFERTPEREVLVNFTAPYYEDGYGSMSAIFYAESDAVYTDITSTLEEMLNDGTVSGILSKYKEYLSPTTKPTTATPPTTKPTPITSPTTKPTQSSREDQSTCLAVGCKNLPNKFNLYCSEHACAKSGCTSEKSYSSSFCNSHKCSSIGCDRGRNDSGSYCSEHACAEPNCSREKHYGYASIYCSYHECDDVGCEKRRKDYGSYCSEHECADPYCTFQKSVLSDYCLIHDD